MVDNNPFNGTVWGPLDVWTMINGKPNEPDKPGLLKKSMGPMRVAQHIFQTIAQGNDNPFPADVVDEKGIPTTGYTKSFATIRKSFQLFPVHIDISLTMIKNQVALAAQALALAEDMLFFQGGKAELPRGLSVVPADKKKLENGLLGIAEANKQTIAVPLTGHNESYGAATYAAVVQGISIFTSKSQGSPYAVILEPAMYADANFPLQDSSIITPASAIQSLVETGGLAMSPGLPAKTGLLISLGGQTTTLHVGTEPVVHWDNFDNGVHSFTATESIQFYNIDARSLIKLEFLDRQ